MTYQQNQTSYTRSAASMLVFVIFLALSFLTYDYLAGLGYGAWEQVAIPVSIEWLAFIGLMKLLWE